MKHGICVPKTTFNFNVEAENGGTFTFTYTEGQQYEWEEVEHGFLVKGDGEYHMCFDEDELAGLFVVLERIS